MKPRTLNTDLEAQRNANTHFARSISCAILTILCASLSYFVDIPAQSTIFFLNVIGCLLLLQGRGIDNPVVAVGVFMFLYGVIYPLNRHFMGVPGPLVRDLIPISMWAYSSYLAAALLFDSTKSTHLRWVPPVRVTRVLLICLTLACLILLLALTTLGFVSKREFLSAISTTNWQKLVLLFQIVPFAFALHLLALGNAGARSLIAHVSRWEVFFALLLGVAIMGIIGERDFLFRMLFFWLLVVISNLRADRFWIMPLSAAIALGAMPFTQGLKAFVVSGADISSVGQDILTNEFTSAGSNFSYVYERSIRDSTFPSGLARTLSPLLDGQSSTEWFNTVIRPSYGDGGTSGWGFSLVAEAWVNFDLPGVLGVYFVLGAVAGLLHRLSRRGVGFYLFYLGYLSTLVYAQRADISNVINLSLKVNGVMIIVLLAMAWVVGASVGTRHGQGLVKPGVNAAGKFR